LLLDRMIYVVYYILQYLWGVMWLSPRELAGDDALLKRMSAI
jgi:hypothetical protein